MSRITLTWCLATGVCLGVGYGSLARAEAGAGARQADKPLFYSGTLTDAGQPADGKYKITLKFYAQEQGGDAFCSSETGESQVSYGRFRVDVSDCAAELRMYSDVWFGLSFTNHADGILREIPVRARIAAVPYALAAEHAASASVCESAQTASTAERLGSLGESELQRVLSADCPAGSSLRKVAANGDVECETDDNTVYAGANGIALDGATFSADTNYIQRRVESTCGVGSSIRSIASDGSVTCEPATRITAWTSFSPELLTSGPGNPAVVGIKQAIGSWRRVGDSMEVRETIRFDANSTDDNYIVFKLPIGATSVISSDAYNLGGADVWTGPTDSICYVQNFAAYAGGVIVGCAQSPVKRSQLGVSPKPYYISMFYTVQIVGWTTTTPTNED